jgi:hypothetical protein
MAQADSKLERLLTKGSDTAFHLFGDSSDRGLRLGVRPQITLICLGPGATLNPSFPPSSFHSLFPSFSHSRISTHGVGGLESISLWHDPGDFVHY